MKNKKAESLLPTEIVKMVLTIICLFFLAYLLFLIYSTIVNSNRLSQAQESIDRIDQALNHMKLNNLNNYTLDNLLPEKWFIFGFAENELKPNVCGENSCLCICKNSGDSKQLEKCSDKGACLGVIGLKDFQEFELGLKEGVPVGIHLFKNNSIIEVKQA